MLDFYTALSIGLIGSFHCIGMCGPIAIALPLGNKDYADRAFGGLIYNLGRTITYGVMGIAFGLLGKGIHMAGFQQWASIVLGSVMVLSVFFPFLFRGRLSPQNLYSGYSGALVGHLKKLFGRHSKCNLLVIGLLNGLLPCGLVYVAIAGALNTGDAMKGALFMMVFGIGTIPIMLSISIVGNVIGQNIKNKLAKVVPIFIVALGIIFILRGLSLGIPYISPQSKMLSPEKEIKVKGSCCSPGNTKDM